MDNIDMSIKDDRYLVITVDLKAPTTPSASGKTDVLASTRGNADVPGQAGVKIGLNIYRTRK
jgi:hypothetical protein